jgi:RNA polymerase sigma-70 factor (ECF subfamily)
MTSFIAEAVDRDAGGRAGTPPISPEFGARTGGGRDPSTSWTLIKKVLQEDDDGVAALEKFARLYMPLIHAYIARRVRNRDLADELTQEFFTRRILASQKLLRKADRQRGRFRAWLTASIKNFLIDEHRGGRRQPLVAVHPDGSPGGWDALPGRSVSPPDEELVRDWGRSVIQRAIAQVKHECERCGQRDHFQMFVGRFLADPDAPESFKSVGLKFGLGEKDARSRIQPVVRRFQRVLKALLAEDAFADERPEDEIRKLIGLYESTT